MSGAIDLSKLPAPSFLLETSYETLFQELLVSLAVFDPDYVASIKVGDPGYNILLAAAYQRMLDRQKINEAGRSVMLAYATGGDLDNLAAYYRLTRLVIDPGDPNAVPPVDPIYEDDDSFRQKVLLAPEGFTTAGSIGAYRFHALTAGREVSETVVESSTPSEVVIRKRIIPSALGEAVKDVSVTSPATGQVQVAVLSYSGNGVPSIELVDAVEAALNAESVRPLTDQVQVLAATIIEYAVDATLYFLPGIDRNLIIEAAESALQLYVDESHRMGRKVTVSGIQAACYKPGVVEVTVASPAADIDCTEIEAGFCTGITLNDGGLG